MLVGVELTFQSPLSGKPERYRSTRFTYGEIHPNLRFVFTSKMRTHLPGRSAVPFGSVVRSFAWGERDGKLAFSENAIGVGI